MTTPYVRLHGEPGAIYCTIIGANGEPVWTTAQGRGLNRRREVWNALNLIGEVKFDKTEVLIYTTTGGQRTHWTLPIRDEVAKRRSKAVPAKAYTDATVKGLT